MWNNLRLLTSRLFPPAQKLGIPATNSITIQKSLSTVPLSVTRCPILLGGSNGNRSLLNPSSNALIQSTEPQRGMKIMGKVRRRCKDCYLIWEQGILHNRCKTHPRHTQKLKPKYWATQRLMTHATSGFKRPW